MTSIGISVFNGCHTDLTIHAPNGSFAHQYAQVNGISFYNSTGAGGNNTFGPVPNTGLPDIRLYTFLMFFFGGVSILLWGYVLYGKFGKA